MIELSFEPGKFLPGLDEQLADIRLAQVEAAGDFSNGPAVLGGLQDIDQSFFTGHGKRLFLY